MKLFIFPGELGRAFYENLLDGQSRVSISCALFDDAALAAKWTGYVPPEAIWHWDRLTTPDPVSVETPLHRVHYERVLRAMMADPRTYYILERQFRVIDTKIFFNSVFNRTVELEILVWNTLTMLNATKPDRFVHYNVPHGKLWFVARVSELTGIEAYVAATSPLPWKDWAVRGLDEQQPVVPSEAAPATAGSRIMDFVNTARGNYATAMPSYEKKRFDYFKGGFYSPRKELRSLAYAVLTTRSAFTGVMRGLHSLRKRAAVAHMNACLPGSRCRIDLSCSLCIISRNGRRCRRARAMASNGWRCEAMANALPEGYQLVVKEHPSTFRYNFDPSFRSLELHEQISRLPNTRLVPLNFRRSISSIRPQR